MARKPSDIYWNGIRTFGIFCDYGLSIPEYVSLAVKLKEQKSVSRLGNRNDDAEENNKDDSDAGDIGNIRFWNLPIYHDDWRDNLTIELTQEEAFYLDKQIQKSTKGSLLEYVLKNHIDLNEYDDFASLTAELSEKVSEKLAYMMKLACDFNNLVYMARVRYNVMLSEGENTYANDEWSRLLPDIRHNATVDLDAVFGELHIGHLKKEMNNVILIYGLCDMVHRAMTLVKYFTPNFGEEYYDVLYGCYCRSRKAADVDIMIELGMSRATFYRKKKAALRYLGYYFFEIVVPQSASKRYKPSFPVEEE